MTPREIRETIEAIRQKGCCLTRLNDGSYVARIRGDDPEEAFGRAVVVSPLDDDVAEVQALQFLPTTEQWRMLEEELRRTGFRSYEFDTADGKRHRKPL